MKKFILYFFCSSFLFSPQAKGELHECVPSLQEGVCFLLTGLSAAGKTTLANSLNKKLLELQNRPVRVLDGDEIRKNLCNDLDFSREGRSSNVKRVAYVASQLVSCRSVAICALIAPYREDREYFRDLINPHGRFVEIYLSTPLSACEQRDPKGLYKKARSGLIKQFTGIDDPYEEPQQPDITIDMSQMSVSEAVNKVVNFLKQEKLIPIAKNDESF